MHESIVQFKTDITAVFRCLHLQSVKINKTFGLNSKFFLLYVVEFFAGIEPNGKE